MRAELIYIFKRQFLQLRCREMAKAAVPLDLISVYLGWIKRHKLTFNRICFKFI